MQNPPFPALKAFWNRDGSFTLHLLGKPPVYGDIISYFCLQVNIILTTAAKLYLILG